jgi:hypothetical protein
LLLGQTEQKKITGQRHTEYGTRGGPHANGFCVCLENKDSTNLNNGDKTKFKDTGGPLFS